MARYSNVMEFLVEETFNTIAHPLDCCQCERCRNDIIAYALNQLPPKYVVSAEGEVYSKLYMLKSQNATDIIRCLTAGTNLVRENPRH